MTGLMRVTVLLSRRNSIVCVISFFNREKYYSHPLHFFNIFKIIVSALKMHIMRSSRSTVIEMAAIIQVYVCERVGKKKEKLQISSQLYIITE